VELNIRAINAVTGFDKTASLGDGFSELAPFTEEVSDGIREHFQQATERGSEATVLPA